MSLEGTQGMDNNKVSAYGAGVAVGGFGQDLCQRLIIQHYI